MGAPVSSTPKSVIMAVVLAVAAITLGIIAADAILIATGNATLPSQLEAMAPVGLGGIIGLLASTRTTEVPQQPAPTASYSLGPWSPTITGPTDVVERYVEQNTQTVTPTGTGAIMRLDDAATPAPAAPDYRTQPVVAADHPASTITPNP